MALVDYGSDSDSGSPPPPAPPATKPSLPPLEGAQSDDEADEGGDPADAFGIGKLEKEEQSKGSSVVKGDAGVSSAPQVVVNDPTAYGSGSTSLVTRPTDQIVFFNPTYEDLSRPVQGPANPWNERRLEKQNTLTGHVEQQAFSELTFRTQQRSFQTLGYAANPSILAGAGAPALVGDVHAAWANGGNNNIGEVRTTKAQRREVKRKRKGKGTLGEFDSDSEDEFDEVEQPDGTIQQVPRPKAEKPQKEYLGPWAGWEGESLAPAGPTEEEWDEQEARGGAPLSKKARKAVVDQGRDKAVAFGEETSVFHGKQLRDYQGRTYLHVPTDVDVNLRPSEPGLQETYVPKRCIHTWSGHTKGVSRIQLFPGSGHLLLSASMDTRVKLWDVYGEGKCLRTFNGHSKAVHDITFNNSGDRFLSAAYDRQMKLWDTESGACVKAFSNGKVPYCVKFHPAQQNIFLAGMHDRKIIQYDLRSGEITQEYDQHLGPVNTINFVDDDRRFVTTSDDKMVRVWDFDIPVSIKIISEPSMHSMPAVGVDPKKKWLAMQSLDNQIVVFGADSFKQNRKKRFAGHTIAGYACEPQFSPDGKYLSSGDGQGNLIVWDWKSTRIQTRIKAHSQALISHAWLPHETSKVVTSSWDNTIKLWA